MINNLTFSIMCPNCSTGGLKNTVNSIRIHFPDNPIYAIVEDKAKDGNVRDLEKYATVVRAGKTITSMIDKGMEISKEWSISMFGGSWLRKGMMAKYFYFTRQTKDILFPVIDRKWLFHEGSINGLLIHRSALEEVGKFGDDEDSLANVKLYWADRAIGKNFQFKGMVGVRFL